MQRIRRLCACVIVTAPLLLVGCGGQRPEEQREPLPAGVDVGPPRRAAETGGLILPGQQPDERLQTGATDGGLDTVSSPVVGPEQAPQAPAQQQPGATQTPPAQQQPGAQPPGQRPGQ